MNEFDLVVLGGGSGSQVATAAAEDGLETAVLEPGPLGGACITRGCVPSKALVHRADLLEEIRRADRFGIEATVDDAAFGSFTDDVRETVYEKAERQAENLREAENVTLYRAAGRFVDEHTVELAYGRGGPDGDGGTGEDGDGPDGGGGSAGETADRNAADGDRIRGECVVIAVGARPATPPIDGLEDVDALTSDDALFLDERPGKLAVVGGGYVGVELAHVFDAFGTDVSIVGRPDRLLPREDDDVSAAVTRALERRVDVYAGHEATAVAESDGGVTVTVEPSGGSEDGDGGDGEPRDISADEVLVAAGRRPNTDGLHLEAAGVETDDGGHVEVDEFLKTDAECIWALGDVIGQEPYKHAADYESRVVATNVLEETQRRVDYRAMPHAVFTDPKVASVGRTEAELEEAGAAYDAATVDYDVAPLGLLLEEPESFVKVLASPDGEILGCHVVGPDAPTLIQEVVLAMDRASGTVEDVADVVHVHPALSEVLLGAFDQLSSSPYSTAPDWRDVGGE